MKTTSVSEPAEKSTDEPMEAMDVEKKPNPALDSFESMMAAMDAELERAKAEEEPTRPKVQFSKPASKPASKPTAKTKGKAKLKPMSMPTEEELDAMDDDAVAAMDAELRQALVDAGEDPDAIPEAEDLDPDQKREYAMMRDLLESYKSQEGNAGVVGNLFGRLGK